MAVYPSFSKKDYFDFSEVEIVGGAHKKATFFLFVGVLVSVVISILFPSAIGIVALLFFLILSILVHHLTWGLYALIAASPFLGLVVHFSSFEWTERIPYIHELDFPLVDGIALFVFFAWCIRRVLRSFSFKKEDQKSLLPGFFYFLPFLLVSGISVWFAESDLFFLSLKYWLRPILFLYLLFFVLPYQLIQNKTILRRVLGILFSAGIFTALLGLFSFFTKQGSGVWRRAIPIELFGMSPIGYNHNLLAEILVATAPIGIYFLAGPGRSRFKQFIVFCMACMILIGLATFTRTGWIAFGVELLVYLLLVERQRARLFLQRAAVALLTIVPLAVYMIVFSFSDVVGSSTNTRLDLTGIAVTYFVRNPFFGTGPGTFVSLVEGTRVFGIEYGDPIDAHGVIQKLIAEGGLFGLITFFLFVGWIIYSLFSALARTKKGSEEWSMLLALTIMAIGSITYQLFNTSYYNSKLWVPLGIAFVGVELLRRSQLHRGS